MRTAMKKVPGAPPNSRHPFFWIALICGATVFALYVFACSMVLQYGALGRVFGWSYITKSDGCYVNYVGTADDLQIGDRVLAINGDTTIGAVNPLRILRDIPPDGAYTVSVLRGTSEHEYQFNLPLVRNPQNLVYIFPKLLVNIAFYVVGFLLGLLKPQQRVAQIACLASLADAILFLGLALGPLSFSLFQGYELAIDLFL